MADENAPLIPKIHNKQHHPPVETVVLERNEGEEEEATTDYGSGNYPYPTYLQAGHFTSLEKLMFFVSSILLILLCVFVGLYARSAQNNKDVSFPIPLPPSHVGRNESKAQKTCTESPCIIAAAQILQDVDQTLNPCNDFYAYTCQQWQENHIISDAKSRVDTFSLLTETTRHGLHQILGRDRFQQQPSLLPDPNLILEQQLFTKLSDYYNACMNQDMIEAKGIVPLYTVFREIKQFLPLDMHQESSTKGLTNALMSLSHRQIWAMFEMNIIPDYTHPSTPSIEVIPGQVGLPTRESYDDPDIVSTYMSVVTDILDIIFKKDTSGEFGWRNWSPVATARRIVEFEKKIAQSTVTTDQIPKQYTLDELQQIVPEIEWVTFIQAMIPGKHTLNIPNHVSLPFPNFIQHLSQDVLSTANTRTLQTYLVWRSIWKYLDVLGEEFVSHKRRLDAKLRGIEPRARPERWETCLDMIDHSPMGMLLGHYFILNKMNQTAKVMVEDMSVKVIHTLKDRVPYLEWAQDQQTKDQIINKLDSLSIQVGYSTSSPDVTSAISLSEYYRDVKVDKDDFFGNVVRANKHDLKQTWLQLGKPVDRNAWNVNPQSVTPTFNKELNKILIPGGLLQQPFFDSYDPEYLIYSTIGWMLGHEILHAFDSNGRKYDNRGVLGHWWTDQAEDLLDSQNQCLISQYDALGADGKRTLNNNYADHGGLVASFLAYNATRNHLLIPGLEHWSRDQLFFIQYARMKCSKSTVEYNRLVKNYSPDRLRVNVPLMNSKHFATAFECKVGSYMNPAHKCQVW